MHYSYYSNKDKEKDLYWLDNLAIQCLVDHLKEYFDKYVQEHENAKFESGADIELEIDTIRDLLVVKKIYNDFHEEAFFKSLDRLEKNSENSVDKPANRV